jgi:hypothetical protein
MDFPRTIDEITPEWLTKVLRESGAIDGAEVESFEAATIGDDQGIQGDVNRLSLAYDKQELGAPESLVVKLSVTDDERRAQLASSGSSEREVNFYKELASQAGISTPEVYFSGYNPDSDHMNIVQEDLGQYRMVEQADDCSFDDATAALTGLAQMHGKWWDSDRLLEFPWISVDTDSERIQGSIERYNARLETCFEVLGEWLPAGFERIARQYAGKIQDVRETFHSGALTLTHNDFRTGNLAFDDTDPANKRVIAFDWAGASRAKGARDVSYFMSLNLEVETRRGIESQLQRGYHDQLVDQGVKNYSFDEFLDDYRLGLFSGVRVAVEASPLLEKMIESEAGLKRIAAMCGRLQIVVDWNIEELIPK